MWPHLQSGVVPLAGEWAEGEETEAWEPQGAVAEVGELI